MGVIPDKPFPRVQFYNTKLPHWVANTTAIGLTSAAVTSLTAKVEAALEKYNAHLSAQSASKTATEAWLNAASSVTSEGASMMMAIRSKAEYTKDLNVYTLADIPAPASRTPVTTLGTPTGFKATLDGDGSLTLTWKCSSPRATGVVYELYRKLDDAVNFTSIGGTGKKKYVDTSIPSGTGQAVYKIRATRSTAVGPWAQFIVAIGNAGVGEQLKITQPKLAA